VDWEQIRTDYITGDDSYRQLAEKYGINYSVLGRKGRQEGWVEQRTQYRNSVHTKTVEKIANREAGQNAKRAAKVGELADALLLKLGEAIESGDLDPKSIRSLTASLRDLQEIKGDKSELDRQEQEARIAALRAKSQTDEDDDETGVILMPPRLEVGSDG